MWKFKFLTDFSILHEHFYGFVKKVAQFNRLLYLHERCSNFIFYANKKGQFMMYATYSIKERL